MDEGRLSRLRKLEVMARQLLPSPRCRCSEPIYVTVNDAGRPVCDQCGGVVNVKDVELPRGAVPPTADD